MYIEYLFDVSLVLLVFGFLWKWIVALPLALFQIGTGGFFLLSRLFKAIGYYLIASFMVAYSFAYSQQVSKLYAFIFYISGGIILLLNIASSYSQNLNQLKQSDEHEMYEEITKDFALSLLAMLIYIVGIFIPAISINKFTVTVLNHIATLWNIPILGVILKLVAIAYVFYFLFLGFIVLLTASGWIYKTFICKTQNEQQNILELGNSSDDNSTNEKGKLLNTPIYDDGIDNNYETATAEVIGNKLFNYILNGCENFLNDKEIIEALDISEERKPYIFSELLAIYFFIVKYFIRTSKEEQSEQIIYYLNHYLSTYALDQSYNEESSQCTPA